jgi:hypothetical protein
MLEYVPSELDLFTSQPIQTSLIKSSDYVYNPLTTLDNCSTIQFCIPGFQDQYKDLNHIYLKLSLQITKNNGTLFDSKEETPSIVNNVLHSIFKGCTVELNNQIVSSSQSYHYKSYLENLLNYQKNCAENYLQCEGWFLDEAGKFDSNENHGLQKRCEKFKDTKIFEVIGKLHADVFNMNKLLLCGVDLKVTLEMEKKHFYLMQISSIETAETKQPEEVNLRVCEAQLYVRHLTINSSILLAHHKILTNRNAIYNFKRNVIKNFTLSTGITTQNFENIFSGQLPTNVLVALVDNNAFNGQLKLNPFNFQHFNLAQISLNVNGISIPNYPLTLNAEKGLVTRVYKQLYDGLNIHNKDIGLQFSAEGFQNGFAIFAFNLSPCNGVGVMNINENGILKMELKFDKALEKSVTVIIYSEFNSNFQINQNKNIILNY